MLNEEVKLVNLLDKATKTAVLAKSGGIQTNQISNLLSVLESDEGSDAVHLLLAHIVRQSQRVWADKKNPKKNQLITEFTNQLLSDIQELLRVYEKNEVLLVDSVKKYLGLIKWVFDATGKFDSNLRNKNYEEANEFRIKLAKINSFSEFLDMFIKSG